MKSVVSSAEGARLPVGQGPTGHLLVYIPAYNKYPLDKARKKVGRSPEQLDNVKSGQRKAVSTYEEYIKNIAQPQLDAFIKSFNPEFVSRSDLNAEQIIRKKRNYLFSKEAYENYIKKLSPQRIEQILENIPLNAAKYAAKMTFGDWRLEGALKIILGWLGGNKKITSALRNQDKLIQGEPVLITLPERAGEFKIKLRALLKRMLDIIQHAHYDPKVITEENDRLNQFVDSYSPEFVVSIKWVVIPDTGTPADSTEVKEIVYEIYSSFIGEEKAKDIRRTSIETVYHYPLNPAEYIGNPGKKAYFDMFLDIRIETKERKD